MPRKRKIVRKKRRLRHSVGSCGVSRVNMDSLNKDMYTIMNGLTPQNAKLSHGGQKYQGFMYPGNSLTVPGGVKGMVAYQAKNYNPNTYYYRFYNPSCGFGNSMWRDPLAQSCTRMGKGDPVFCSGLNFKSTSPYAYALPSVYPSPSVVGAWYMRPSWEIPSTFRR